MVRDAEKEMGLQEIFGWSCEGPEKMSGWRPWGLGFRTNCSLTSEKRPCRQALMEDAHALGGAPRPWDRVCASQTAPRAR